MGLIMRTNLISLFVCTFGAKKAHGVVGAVAIGFLLLIQAPETHIRVCMNLFSSFTGWNPFSSSGFNCPWIFTHSGAIVESYGIQLLIVTTASGVVNIEPGGPVIVIF